MHFSRSNPVDNVGLGALGYATTINNAGLIVGAARLVTGSFYYQATVFDDTGRGSNLNLGTLGGEGSQASDVNSSGTIVGGARLADGYSHATMFDPAGNGANIDLGSFGYVPPPSDLGLGSSWASAINDLGQIVGWSRIASGESRATLFDPTGDGDNIDLNDLVYANPGWVLEYATDVNNHGWIVGAGLDPQGDTRAFLLIPIPGPATLALLALGGLGLLRQRRRG